MCANYRTRGGDVAIRVAPFPDYGIPSRGIESAQLARGDVSSSVSPTRRGGTSRNLGSRPLSVGGRLLLALRGSRGV